jgi:hypothetical protein
MVGKSHAVVLTLEIETIMFIELALLDVGSRSTNDSRIWVHSHLPGRMAMSRIIFDGLAQHLVCVLRMGDSVIPF